MYLGQERWGKSNKVDSADGQTSATNGAENADVQESATSGAEKVETAGKTEAALENQSASKALACESPATQPSGTPLAQASPAKSHEPRPQAPPTQSQPLRPRLMHRGPAVRHLPPQPPVRPMPPKQTGEVGDSSNFVVVGCADPIVGSTIRGNYALSPSGLNHGKPVYKRDGKAPNGFDVVVFFWDDRDGPKNCGWWFAPTIGSEQVWAYHPSRASTPPTIGWNVPIVGPVDKTIFLRPARPPVNNVAQQQLVHKQPQSSSTSTFGGAPQLLQSPNIEQQLQLGLAAQLLLQQQAILHAQRVGETKRHDAEPVEQSLLRGAAPQDKPSEPSSLGAPPEKRSESNGLGSSTNSSPARAQVSCSSDNTALSSFSSTANPFSKNVVVDPRRICRWYQQGECWKGDKCSFVHVDIEQQRDANSALEREDMGKKSVPTVGNRPALEASSISHNDSPGEKVESPLPFVPKLNLSMEICASFTAGSCRFGELCQFIHVDPLLAPPPVTPMKAPPAVAPPPPLAPAAAPTVAAPPVALPVASLAPVTPRLEPCHLFKIGQCALGELCQFSHAATSATLSTPFAKSCGASASDVVAPPVQLPPEPFEKSAGNAANDTIAFVQFAKSAGATANAIPTGLSAKDGNSSLGLPATPRPADTPPWKRKNAEALDQLATDPAPWATGAPGLGDAQAGDVLSEPWHGPSDAVQAGDNTKTAMDQTSAAQPAWNQGSNGQETTHPPSSQESGGCSGSVAPVSEPPPWKRGATTAPGSLPEVPPWKRTRGFRNAWAKGS